MTWKPNMTEEERERLNTSRRRSYAKRRISAGLTYKGKSEKKEEKIECKNLLEIMRKLNAQDSSDGDSGAA